MTAGLSVLWLENSLPWFARKKRNMKRLAFSPALFFVQMPLSSQSPDIVFSLRWQPIIPIKESGFLVSVRRCPYTAPVSGFQPASVDNVHEVPALRAKRPVEYSPSSDPGLTQQIQHEVLCPMKRMAEIDCFVFTFDQDPSLIGSPGSAFTTKPCSPDMDSKIVCRENETYFPAKSRCRRYKTKPSEVCLKLHVCNTAETHFLKRSFQSLKVLFFENRSFRHDVSPPFVNVHLPRDSRDRN